MATFDTRSIARAPVENEQQQSRRAIELWRDVLVRHRTNDEAMVKAEASRRLKH